MRRKHTKSYSFTLSRRQIFFLAILSLLLCGVLFSLGLVGGYGMFAASLHQQLPQKAQLESSQEKSKEASFYESLVDDIPSTKTTAQPSEQQKTLSLVSGTSPYQVQVGAFRQAKEAQVLQKRLQEKGYHVDIAQADLKNKGVWFRVRVGNCISKEEAQKLANQLKKEHLPTLIVK